MHFDRCTAKSRENKVVSNRTKAVRARPEDERPAVAVQVGNLKAKFESMKSIDRQKA
jgi:hypothetical protein